MKQEKHDVIKPLAQSKLDSAADIISQAMQDGDISFIEFRKVLQEVEKYRKLKADIRSQAKTKVRHITKEQRNSLLISKFIQARNTDGTLWAKNNIFVLCDGAFDSFFKLFLCFHAILTGYIQLFCKF